jgi:phospholipid-translocating ATPase
MAVAAVIITNFYQGFNTLAWNWFVLAGVLLGPVLIVCYIAIYAAISPGWIWTKLYGFNQYWWPSAYFWLGLCKHTFLLLPVYVCTDTQSCCPVFAIILSFLPKYFMRYWNENYRPTDVDVLKYISKHDPNHDFTNDPMIPGSREFAKRHGGPVAPHALNAQGAKGDVPMGRLGQQGRTWTDMSNPLGHVSSRGFAFVSLSKSVHVRSLFTNTLHNDRTRTPIREDRLAAGLVLF